MKVLLLAIGLGLCLFVAVPAHGGIPPMNVTVSDASGKLAFRGVTKSDGGFATEKLQPGKYVVQFSSNNAVKSGQYSLVVAAGKKKVVADAVAGEKFLGAGVAMKVEVGTGLNIIGQVAVGPVANVSSQNRDTLRRMQDRAQDSHQDGFHQSMSQTADKMTRPGN